MAWGGINGIYQIMENILNRKYKLPLISEKIGGKMFKMLGTFALIDFSWIFFRADNISSAFQIIRRIFMVNNMWIFFDGTLGTMGLDFKDMFVLFIALEILMFVSVLQYRNICIRDSIAKQNIVFRYIVYIVPLILIAVYGIYGASYDATSFIYFQF